MKGSVAPSRYPPPVDPRNELIKRELDPEDERIDVGVAIVGGARRGWRARSACGSSSATSRSSPSASARAVIEKAEVCGGHTLSGAMMRPSGLQQLLPETAPENWPTYDQVERDSVYWMLGPNRELPFKPTPPPFRNHGNYVVSVAELSRWLAERAEEDSAFLLTETAAASC